ncbi:hypothetical protein ACHAXA_006028 [Cyclostephanos tholiformis]|uniref:C2 domain-containing protein n=1 Tax=Cyclostephanos tholiformis TaxID=382380 RepID=A0ABD3R3M9_9STRA
MEDAIEGELDGEGGEEAEGRGGEEDDGGGRTRRRRRFDIIVIGMQEAAFLAREDNTTETEGGYAGGDGSGGRNGDARRLQSQSDDDPSSSSSSNILSSTPSKLIDAISTPIISSVEMMSNGVEMIGREGNRRRKGAVRMTNRGALILRSLGLTSRSTVYRSPVLRSPSTRLGKLGGSSDAVGGGTSSRYDTRVLHNLIENRCPSYGIVTSNLRGQMRLFVLALKSLIGEISDVYVNAENNGIGKVFANKGGIITTFDIRDTRLSFLTAHLAAHEGETYYRNRNKGIARILDGAKTDPNYSLQDASIISHHMFVFGDLNYRTNFGDVSSVVKVSGDGNTPPNDGVEGIIFAADDSHFNRAKDLIDAEDWEALNDSDELSKALMKKECLVGFTTLPCNFPPTFKVARGEGYQYNEKRTPRLELIGCRLVSVLLGRISLTRYLCSWMLPRELSYTDRILWKSADGLARNVIPLLYEPCSDFITSDHKPIRGGYMVKTNGGPAGQKNMVTTESAKLNERKLNLFVSDIECSNLPIMDSAVMGGLSDPYVLFLSYPKSLLWKNGWISTEVIKRNLNPVWKDTIHLEVDGDARNLLAGSMLFMTVMDDDFNGADTIGTVALNLKDLCCNLNVDDSSNLRSSGRGSLTMKLIRRSSNSPWPVQETKLSRPILRNGQEFGVLKCTVSTAFLTAKETKAFLRVHRKQRPRMNQKVVHSL